MRRPLPALGVVAGLLALTGAAVYAGILPTPPSQPFIPPVGNQPRVAAAPCSFAALGAGEIRTLYTLPDETGPSGVKAASTFAVFPDAPCHVFRSLRSQVTRSDQSGSNPATVFTDQTASYPFSRGPITISPVLPADSSGQLFFYDQSGTNGVFHSSDYGATWDERDGGLYAGGALSAPAGPSGGITAFAVAPSDPNYLYLVGSSNGQTVFYSSADGGNSWSAQVAPQQGLTTIAVDPRSPSHVFVAGQGVGGTAPDAFYESSSAGATGSWAQHPGPAGASAPVTLVVSNPGTLRVYAETVSSSGVHEYWRTETLGATWLRAPVAASGSAGQLVFDPADPNLMLLARSARSGSGLVLELVASFDGFSSARFVKTIPMPASVGAVEARADSNGDFFAQATDGGNDQLLAFRLSALAPAPAPPPPAANNLVGAIKECPLQPLAGTPSGPLGTQTRPPAYDAGSVAFDGRYLDYTQDELAPNVVFRLDATDCSPAPSITLPAADTGGTALALYELTYDSRYVFANGDTGALLARGPAASGNGATDPRFPAGVAPVYAVDVRSDPAVPRIELAGGVFCGGRQPQCSRNDPTMFAYDPYRDAVWAPIPPPPPDSLALSGLVSLGRGTGMATSVPTCMTGFQLPDQYINAIEDDWAPGDRDVLYVGLEDYGTVLKVNSRTCQVVDSFQHAQAGGGAANDDDQMACDPIDFRAGAPGVPAGQGTSVLWLRDSAANMVRAYPIAHGFCPFPTSLSASAPASAKPGDTVGVCATLAAISAGERAPVAGAPIVFSIAGHPVGAAVSDASGSACVPTVVPGVSGVVSMLASFAGNEAYQAASASVPVRVVVKALPAQGAGAQPAVPPQPPPPGAAVVPIAPPAAQTQVQGQAQLQVQAQAQGQPGAAAQRRTQARLVLQQVGGARSEVELEASRAQAALLVDLLCAGIFATGIALAVADVGRRRRYALTRTTGLPRPARRGGGRR